jgi:tRNA pseudouridine38-40 synthase
LLQELRESAPLAGSVVFTDAHEVTSDFHARFSAQSREYVYRVVWNEPNLYGNIFEDSRAWFVPHHTLNIDAMQEAAAYFVGRHDFSSFVGRLADGKDPVRWTAGERCV